jgi:hypothetical protein
LVETKTKTNNMKKYIYKIEQDSNPESPREWDNFGKMVCFHNRYNLGDKHDYKSNDYDGWEEVKEQLIKDGAKVILPVYMYDHSGITISTAPFGCRFDSGQVGFIYCTAKDMDSDGMAGKIDEDRAIILLKGEIESYDSYLRGEVYGYRVFEQEECSKGHLHEEELDSCWGYYSEEDATAEAECIIEYYKNKELKTA